jgi:TolB-like protein
MKKAIVCVFLACLLPAAAFAQNALTLDAELSNSTTYFSNILPANTKVVVLNCTSKWPDLSDYIIEELIGYIVNERKLTVVDRQNIENIRREMDFQLSGDVSDETAQSIGKMLGAQTIISGSITAIGNAYRLRIRAIAVETAQILGMQNVDVAQDSRTAALTGTAYTGPAVVAAAPRPSGTTNVTITPADTPLASGTTNVSASSSNTGFIELASAGWKVNTDIKSYLTFTTKREKIDGEENEVLTLNLNLATTSTGAFFSSAYIYTDNASILQKLKRGSGVRFRVLGDGKTWELRILTKEVSGIQFHRALIATQKDLISDIDIHYSKLRSTVPFNKSRLNTLEFGKDNNIPRSAGQSTIKIFDLEVY